VLILPGTEPAYCRRLRKQYADLGFPGTYRFAGIDEETQTKWAEFLRPWLDEDGYTHPSRESAAVCCYESEPKYVGCREPPAEVLPPIKDDGAAPMA